MHRINCRHRFWLAVAAFLGLGSAVHAQPVTQCVDDVTTLTAQGEARIERPATHVDIHARFMERAQTSAAASNALEARFGPLLDRLRARTEKPMRLVAANASITPQWRYDDGDRTLAGFVATRMLRLTDVPVDEAGAWMQTLTDAEPDSLSLENYTARPEGGADAHPALAAAIRNARTRAETMADALGQSIGEALCIHEVSAPSPRPMRSATLAATGPDDATREPSIEPDTVIDHARVTVVFFLEPPSA